MVASSNTELLNAKAASDTRTSVVSSAKMHLGISLAQVLHLRETGGISKEISDKITELHNTLEKRSVPTLAQQSRHVLPFYQMEDPPLKIPVKKDYTPRDDREVMARRGDHVIVYGWIGFEAIAYNARNKTTGTISRTLLNTDKDEEYKDSKLYRATQDGRSTIEYPVSWKNGDYIRVMERDTDSYSYASGICFNLASGQIGQFYTNVAYTLKLVD
ncbi:hypothetical protein PSPO01_16416 [Paraphaeosphaeria sporulosa]